MTGGRKGWESRIRVSGLKSGPVWFHCASLGEFEQGRPIIEAIKRQYPDISIVVTFFSSSGYEIRKNYEQADLIMYLPFDSRANAGKFIELVDPRIAIFIKYEFWHNYLTELKKRGKPVFLVSGIFRKEQKFFRNGWGFFRNMLTCFSHFFVQNKQSQELLHSIGYQNVTVAGDTRFDRVMEVCSHPKQIAPAENFADKSMVMVIGSSWPEDMEVLLPLINNDDYKLKYIIAPHEIERSKIQKLAQSLKCSFTLFSEAKSDEIGASKVLIIDNIGLLSSLYQYGDLAYIGGAFGDGLHNILEAATFGLPIIFGKGKDNHKYQEATDLVALGGAFEVTHSEELINVTEALISDKKIRAQASKISSAYVRDHAGATDTVMKHLHTYLS
jgi:3-deoxy-D-manno-octulosonic-acid transferase